MEIRYVFPIATDYDKFKYHMHFNDYLTVLSSF